jgi:hypothetical protein
MNNLIKEVQLSAMEGSRNLSRQPLSAAYHYLIGGPGWMWSMALSVFRGASGRERVQDAPAISRGSRCVWKLDSEA